MNPQFYVAGTDDIDTILQLQKDFYAIDQYDFNPETAREALLVFIKNANYGKLWLILLNGKVAGYLALTLGYSFEFKGRDAFLDELYLKPEFRGKQLGAKAVDFAAEQAKTMGVKAIHLEVEQHNTAGLSLYRRYGFQDHNRMLMTRWV
jgi:ribosomal protein S18 acetylase RimI-like enzyme